jgi:antitoxin ChpS
MAVPKKILGLVDLAAGSRVELRVRSGRLIVEPARKPRYTLAELLAQCKPGDLAPKRSDKHWLKGGPVGSELL